MLAWNIVVIYDDISGTDALRRPSLFYMEAVSI